MLNANTYVTKEEGIGGTIRNRWEDFYVEEIPEVIPDGEGPNIYIWIEKLGRTTLDVLLDIARDLHIDRKRIPRNNSSKWRHYPVPFTTQNS